MHTGKGEISILKKRSGRKANLTVYNIYLKFSVFFFLFFSFASFYSLYLSACPQVYSSL